MKDNEKSATRRCDKFATTRSLSMHSQDNKPTSAIINDQRELVDATSKDVEQIGITYQSKTVTNDGPRHGTNNELKNVSKHFN